MRVLLVDMGSRHNWTGGQSRVVRMLYDGLRRRGMDTYYLGYETMYMGAGKKGIVLKRDKSLGLGARKSRMSEMRMVRMAYNLAFVSGLRRLGMEKEEILKKAKDIGPDVIISNAISDFPILKYLRKNGMRFKSMYIDHGSASTTARSYFSKEGIPLSMGTGMPSVTLDDKRRKFFAFFDMNIALNDRQYHEVGRCGGRVVIVPNGANVKARRDKAEEQVLRKKHGIGPDDFVVLYIGRLFDRQKNVSTLIKAFRETRNHNFKLLIVGDGPSAERYRELAAEDIRIIFAGTMSDRELNAAYNVSNLFVLPSFWEGFAITVLEAAAHSLPIIMSNGAYVSDLNDDKQNVLKFNERDYYELTELIEKVYSDRKLNMELSRASARISKKFTEKRMINRYVALLKKISAGNKG